MATENLAGQQVFLLGGVAGCTMPVPVHLGTDECPIIFTDNSRESIFNRNKIFRALCSVTVAATFFTRYFIKSIGADILLITEDIMQAVLGECFAGFGGISFGAELPADGCIALAIKIQLKYQAYGSCLLLIDDIFFVHNLIPKRWTTSVKECFVSVFIKALLSFLGQVP
nr:hypothetical protein [Phascolarctobacterium succinatutens]